MVKNKKTSERGAGAFEKLSLQQQQFVLELLKHKFNATKAAIEAGYSEKSARSKASQLLTIVNIQGSNFRTGGRDYKNARKQTLNTC